MLQYISKILANRFKPSLRKLISQNQTTFILGRSRTVEVQLKKKLVRDCEKLSQ